MNEVDRRLPIGLKVAFALVGLAAFLVTTAGFGLSVSIACAAIAGPVNGWWFLLVASIVVAAFGWQIWSLTDGGIVQTSLSDPITLLYFVGLIMSLGPCGLMFATLSATGPMPAHFDLMVEAYGLGWGAFASAVLLLMVAFWVTNRLERAR